MKYPKKKLENRLSKKTCKTNIRRGITAIIGAGVLMFGAANADAQVVGAYQFGIYTMSVQGSQAIISLAANNKPIYSVNINNPYDVDSRKVLGYVDPATQNKFNNLAGYMHLVRQAESSYVEQNNLIAQHWTELASITQIKEKNEKDEEKENLIGKITLQRIMREANTPPHVRLVNQMNDLARGIKESQNAITYSPIMEDLCDIPQFAAYPACKEYLRKRKSQNLLYDLNLFDPRILDD